MSVTMSCKWMVYGGTPSAGTGARTFAMCWFRRPCQLPLQCSNSDSQSKPSRSLGSVTAAAGTGFGGTSTTGNKPNKLSSSTSKGNNKNADSQLQQRKSSTKQSGSLSSQAPKLSSQFDRKSYNNTSDATFEERLGAVKRLALEKKKEVEQKEFGPIDYDAPITSDKNSIGLGTRIGVGAAVLVFGLVFALGDFLPSGSVNPIEDNAVVNNGLSDTEKATLQTRLKEYEGTLSQFPNDPTALQGAAVTSTELGEYEKAASLLDKLTKGKPKDPFVFRLLGEVKYELRDYEGSIAAYKSSVQESDGISFEVMRGLTNSLLAAKRPGEAVEFLLSCRDSVNAENSENKADNSAEESQKVDPVQVELLLGKAYSDWDHVSDAVAVYDRLISTHPNDFRGYLAKGIILRENKNVGDAERMFIQARFFAPEKAKVLVDRYSRR